MDATMQNSQVACVILCDFMWQMWQGFGTSSTLISELKARRASNDIESVDYDDDDDGINVVANKANNTAHYCVKDNGDDNQYQRVASDL